MSQLPTEVAEAKKVTGMLTFTRQPWRYTENGPIHYIVLKVNGKPRRLVENAGSAWYRVLEAYLPEGQ